MCFSNTKNFPYPRRNGFQHRLACAAYCYPPKKRSHMWSIWLHPKWFNMSQITLQIKNRTKINICDETQYEFWGGRWPGQSVLLPDKGMKIAAWCWRKRCWLSIHNKVKSEQHFAVTSAKRVAVFQASWKVVREEVGAQLCNKDNKCSTSQGSKCLQERGLL